MTGKKEDGMEDAEEGTPSNIGESMTSENIDKETIEKEIDIDDPVMHSITFGTPSSWPNSICWSLDDRISVLTNDCIYILRISSSNKRKKHGSPLGMQVEQSYIPNIKTKVYDADLERELRILSNPPENNLDLQQRILFDRATVWRTDLLSQNDSYCEAKWSPLGCAGDGRCVIATLTASGVVRIHICGVVTGVWYACIDVTALLYEHLKNTEWSYKDTTSENDSEDNRTYNRVSHCKRILFTSTMCWGSVLLSCHECLSNCHFDNIYYTSYFVNYAKCKHAKTPLVTASKSGYMFVWLVTFNMDDESLHHGEVLLCLSLDTPDPMTLSWHQITPNEAFIAVGFANGLIRVYRFLFDICEDGSYVCQHTQTLGVWNETDDISVAFVTWILPMDSVLRLVCAKGTDIIVITVNKDEDGDLTCLSCELGPSCHASPITSLQCISHKYVLSGSRAATQYFDIENETVHLCENNILRGFKCFGVTSASNMTMLARVCCPNRLLLQQNSYIKQMEVSFLPFLSTDFIAERLVDESIHLDICVREYITICSAEHFILPQSLHKYCNAMEESSNISLHELQMYLYFNQLRYMQQSGQRVSSLTREEVDSDAVLEDFNDPVIRKIEKAIAIHFYSEMLSKCLQLLENGWVKETEASVLSLFLMADWLVQSDESDDACALPYKCYSLLGETDSAEKLKTLMLQLSTQTKGTVEESNVEKTTINNENDEKLGKENMNKTARSEIEKPDTESTNAEKDSATTPQTFVPRDWAIPREKCPFCEVDASLQSLKHLTCINGHLYSRCCLTLRTTTMNGRYRCCVGCGRTASWKCFESQLNIDSVLLNIDLCPFCGCRFIEHNR